MKEATKYSPKVAASAMRIIPELDLEKKDLKNALVPSSVLMWTEGGCIKALTTKYNDSTMR